MTAQDPMPPVQLAATALSLTLLAGCWRTTKTVILSPTPAIPPEARAEGPSSAATLGVPPGHLPQPGECRGYIPGFPTGRSPAETDRESNGPRALAVQR